MGTKLYSGYERTNRVKLHDTKTKVDLNTAEGAAIVGSIARFASKATEPEDIVNAMQLAECVDITDGSKVSTTLLGRRTITEVTDANGVVHELEDPATIKVYCDNGCTITGTKHEDIVG